MTTQQKRCLEALYHQYNKKRFVHPDPLECLYQYPAVPDREIAGLIASALAYGQVAQILKSVSSVLSVMGKSPYAFLTHADDALFIGCFTGFRHRFANDDHLIALLKGMQGVIARFGSLNHCFLHGLTTGDQTMASAMVFFADALTAAGSPGHLIANPRKGSACKRMHLFLRWMVRKDDVDPGGWVGIKASRLIVPVDTHMHKIAAGFGFTSRKQANMKTALEITQGFKKLCPDDPVKYDFALTRFGIRDDLSMSDLLAETCQFSRK